MTGRPLSEIAFQMQVTDLAEFRGWEWFHVRAGRTLDSWRTPGSGTMARGWPDLVLVRAHDRRLIFAELKRESGKATADQERVVGVLSALRFDARGQFGATYPTIEIHIWWPRDWDEIEQVLK